MTRKGYGIELDWDNYASVDMLASQYGRTKRRIQQILKDLSEVGEIEIVIGVFGTKAIPLYRRTTKFTE